MPPAKSNRPPRPIGGVGSSRRLRPGKCKSNADPFSTESIRINRTMSSVQRARANAANRSESSDGDKSLSVIQSDSDVEEVPPVISVPEANPRQDAVQRADEDPQILDLVDQGMNL